MNPESVSQSNDSIETPSRARFVVAFWLCSMAAVLYLDRVCWGQAAPTIQSEFALSNTQMAYLAMAFQIAYGIFEVPTGRWGELIGARRVLTRVTLWWSAFTALSGAVSGFLPMLFVRFLFGAGEAGAYPNAARVLTRWFPTRERGRVQGVMLSVSLFGGAIAPTVAAELIQSVGWRWNFVIFGSIGAFWAAGFWYWFRDTPDEHKSANSKERKLILEGGGMMPPKKHESIPWRLVLSNPGMFVLSAIAICSAFNSYFYFTWFSTYLQSAHGLNNTQSGRLTSMVLVGGALGVLIGGVVADRLTKSSHSPENRRRVFCSISFLSAALILSFARSMESAFWLASLAALSCFFVQLTLPSWWSSAIEQSGKHVGPLFGLLNMTGTLGALASQWFVGVFADSQKARGLHGREQWDPIFYVYVCVLIVGGISWIMYRKTILDDIDRLR